MNVGIVGHEAAKFTTLSEGLARNLIREILIQEKPTKVISGKCHLGGIDVWAIEEAFKMGIPFKEYPPVKLNWSEGFKPRNIDIAANIDVIYCIVVSKYPDDYDGMRFKHCYHCNTSEHIKSGGCWTAKYAEKLGKKARWLVL